MADLLLRAEPSQSTTEQAARLTEVKRLAAAVSVARNEVALTHEDLRELVNRMAPGLTDKHRVGPVRAAEIILGG